MKEKDIQKMIDNGKCVECISNNQNVVCSDEGKNRRAVFFEEVDGEARLKDIKMFRDNIKECVVYQHYKKITPIN